MVKEIGGGGRGVMIFHFESRITSKTQSSIVGVDGNMWHFLKTSKHPCHPHHRVPAIHPSWEFIFGKLPQGREGHKSVLHSPIYIIEFFSKIHSLGLQVKKSEYPQTQK